MANQARIIQRETKMSYMTCLAIYNGQLILVPKAADCIVQAALKLTKRPKPPDRKDAITKQCQCPRCEP